MSKNFKGYMGDQIGKLGTAVGSRWKGKMIYRAYQGKVRNPKSDAQVLVRARLSLLSKLATVFMPVIGIGMRSGANKRQMTQGNLFVKLNQAAVTGNAGSLTADYATLKVSDGELMGVSIGTPSYSTPLHVTATVTANNHGTWGTSMNDKVYLAAYCPDENQAACSAAVARGEEDETPTLDLTVPTTWQGLRVYVYAFVVSADGRNTSASMNLGYGDIA